MRQRTVKEKVGDGIIIIKPYDTNTRHKLKLSCLRIFLILERDFLISFLILLFSDGTKEKVEDVENAGGES